MNKVENKKITNSDLGLDIIEILKTIIKKKKFVLKGFILSLSIGIIIALVTPLQYQVSSTFIPQLSTSNKTSSISGLASLAGINLNSMGGNENNEISPRLYPEILESYEFKIKVIDSVFVINGLETSFREYFKKESESFLSKILNSKVDDFETKNDEKKPYKISEEEHKLFKILSEKIKLSINENDGFIVISSTLKDKYMAAKLVELSQNILQHKIIEYRIKASKEILNFTLNQYEERKVLYERLQDEIATFKDKNLNIKSSVFNNKLERLNSDLSISKSVLTQLASQLEQAKLKVSQDTPVFTVLKPATIPYKKSLPNRKLIVFIWGFLGLCFSILYVLTIGFVKKFISEIK